MKVEMKFDIGDTAYVKFNGKMLRCEIISISYSKYYSVTGKIVHISYNVHCNNKIQTFNEEQLFKEGEF